MRRGLGVGTVRGGIGVRALGGHEIEVERQRVCEAVAVDQGAVTRKTQHVLPVTLHVPAIGELRGPLLTDLAHQP